MIPQQHSMIPSDHVEHLLQEILLSYRLLFGQDRKSRKLFRTIEHKNLKESLQWEDPLLGVLCGEKFNSTIKQYPLRFWPETCLSNDNQLLEQAVYIDTTDFPIFRNRLKIIQEFCLRQSPSRVRDMWRDRRNPLQWYAFWAVLWIGGITIVIAILQLIVALIQLGVQ